MDVPTRSKGRQMEIVLVEDGLMDARMAVASIERCGVHHNLTLFQNGDEAVRFLSRADVYEKAPVPDLILLDLFLPGQNGFSILEFLIQHESLREVPVIVLTSSDEEEDRRRAKDADVRDFIVKPFNEDKFLSAIREMQSRSLLQDLNFKNNDTTAI